MTAISAAFQNARYDVSPSRLYTVAVRALQACGGDPSRAINRFQELVESDRDLRREIAMEYLRSCAKDMQGRTELRDGVSSAHGRNAQIVTGPVSHPNVVAVDHGTCGEKPNLVVSAATTPVRSDALTARGNDAQKTVSVTPIHNPPRALSARLASRVETAITVLDTFRVRDGRAIGDLQWNELLKIAGDNEREARVLRYVADHVANAPSHVKVRDLVKPEVLEAAIKHAEAVNVVSA